MEGLTDRIDRYRRWIDGNFTVRSGLIDTDRMDGNEHLERWAKVQNMKTLSEMMLDMERRGITSGADLDAKITAAKSERKTHIEAGNRAKKERQETEELRTAVTDYRAGKSVVRDLKTLREKPFGQRKAAEFAAQNADTIRAYEAAKAVLAGYKFEGNKLPDVTALQTKIDRLTADETRAESGRKRCETAVRDCEQMRAALDEFQGKTTEKTHEKQRETERKDHDTDREH